MRTSDFCSMIKKTALDEEGTIIFLFNFDDLEVEAKIFDSR